MADHNPTGGSEADGAPVASVEPLLRHAQDLWWRSDRQGMDHLPRHADLDQAANERHLDRLLGALGSELRAADRSGSDLEALQADPSPVLARMLPQIRPLSGPVLGLDEAGLEALLSGGQGALLRDFAQAARRFDPDVGADAIFQAGRNVLTMAFLGMLLGVPPMLTPSIFAYSMLYPYTDNYLDDPAVSEASKRSFNERFRLRLEGHAVDSVDPGEAAIYRLVGMIEGQYERSAHPQVWAALAAIHRAQERSLRLLHRGPSPYEVDVLGITFEKGGTSVLADAYLLAGSLTERQRRFAFDLGVLLQLGDDLQDVQEDRRSGLSTLFALTAGRWPLDAVTDRAFAFAEAVAAELEPLEPAGPVSLSGLMRRSVAMLIVEAARGAGRLYSKRYLAALEGRSPFRFAYLARRRRELARQRALLIGLLARVPRDLPALS